LKKLQRVMYSQVSLTHAPLLATKIFYRILPYFAQVVIGA
jgi:hypothetical protein